MHDDLLRAATRRARAWCVVLAAVAATGPAGLAAVAGAPVVVAVAIGVAAAALWSGWLLAGAPGVAHQPWPAAGLRPAGLEVSNLGEAIAIASGDTPATAYEAGHDAPNVAAWERGGTGKVLVVTDGASRLLSRDELEAVCATQLAIAHDPACRRLDGVNQAVRLARFGGFAAIVPAIMLASVLPAVGLVVLAVLGPIEAGAWLLGGRIRWWSSVAADAVCIRTTRHPEPLVRGLRALARWNGTQVRLAGPLGWLGIGATAWVVPPGLNWTSTTSVNGRVVEQRSAEMVEDTRLLVRAALVRRVCLEQVEGSLASYGEVLDHVRRAGRAAAAGGVAEVEGELIGLQGVVPPSSPPAWHPDPAGRADLRWWDGTRWTEHTS